MRVLLDTHLVLWAMSDDPRLSAAARQEIERAELVYVSAATIWEISIKGTLGRLEIDLEELTRQLAEAGFEELAVRWAHGRAVRNLPPHHRDPFDRLLIAQAISEPLRLLTHDRLLERYTDLVTVV